MKLQEHLPVDHHLATVYRYGAGLTGVILLVFGSLGFADDLAFFSTTGQKVSGLSSNGLLSLISIVTAAVLIGAAVRGGNLASNINMLIGAVFLLSGFVNLALLDTRINFLAFRLQNVMFSFIVGLMLLTFGMYGRVSGGLTRDNPYWRARHPEEAHTEAAPAPAPATALTTPALATHSDASVRRRALSGPAARAR